MDDVAFDAEDKAEPWFDFGILDIGCVHEWTCVLTSSDLWLNKVWAKCLKAVPADSLQSTQLVKVSDPQRPFERFPQPPLMIVQEAGLNRLISMPQNAKTVDAMGLLSSFEKRNLALSFLHDYWSHKKLTLDERGMRLTRMHLGDGSRQKAIRECERELRQLKEADQPDQTLVIEWQARKEDLLWKSEFDRGTVSNLMAEAGLRKWTPRQAKVFFDSNKKHAKAFFASSPDVALEADNTARQQYEGYAIRFLVPLLQPQFKKYHFLDEIPSFEKGRGPVTVMPQRPGV